MEKSWNATICFFNCSRNYFYLVVVHPFWLLISHACVPLPETNWLFWYQWFTRRNMTKHFSFFSLFLHAEKHCAQRPQTGKYGAEQTVRRNSFRLSALLVSWPKPFIVWWACRFSLPVSHSVSAHMHERPQQVPAPCIQCAFGSKLK